MLLFSVFGFGEVAYVAHLSGILGTGLILYILIKLQLVKAKKSDNDLPRGLKSLVDNCECH
jgi:membrane associated rhomboid family serine protease